MLVVLGFLVAALIGVLVAPAYRRRIARLTTAEIKRSMPLNEAEIRADKDRLRAEHAIRIHNLDAKLDAAGQAAARQMVEINRRDAAISDLEGEVKKLRTFLDEHENARRVLEQTITDRLPKVEHRLTEARRLLGQRDREISSLAQSAATQSRALEEATQINAQLRDDVHRLKATITTRAARNRETLGDARFDGEVALRAEIEALRAKTRDQSSLISRLQGVLVKAGANPGSVPANGQIGLHDADAGTASESELQRLRNDLAEAEAALRGVRGVAESGKAGQDALEAEIRSLKSSLQDQTAEMARLKALLGTYEAGDQDDKAVKESKIAMKARLSALQAQAKEQTATIQSLRAEMAAANERLARQAKHFMDEMRRLGAGTLPASGAAGATRRAQHEAAARRSLADRINEPRPQPAPEPARTAPPRPKQTATPNGDAGRPKDPARVSGFLRALDGASAPAQTEAASGQAGNGEATKPAEPQPAGATASQPPAKAGRKPGLLERITGIEKPVA